MPSGSTLSEAGLREALRAAGLDAPVRFEEVTGSTNALAAELAEGGAPQWTVVGAGHQTAGRGRLGRAWIDRRGDAVLFSVVLRPDLAPADAGILTLGAGVAAAEACRGVSGADVRCRWPNDLEVGRDKVGGILAESRVTAERLEHVVVGVGINLVPPGDVAGAGGIGPADPAGLVGGFLAGLRDLLAPGEPPTADRVIAAYRPLCATLGRRVRATALDGTVVEGEAVDVDGRGSLLVEGPGGTSVVAFGEVLHLRG